MAPPADGILGAADWTEPLSRPDGGVQAVLRWHVLQQFRSVAQAEEELAKPPPPQWRDPWYPVDDREEEDEDDDGDGDGDGDVATGWNHSPTGG